MTVAEDSTAARPETPATTVVSITVNVNEPAAPLAVPPEILPVTVNVQPVAVEFPTLTYATPRPLKFADVSV